MVEYTNKMMKRFECLELILCCFVFLSLQSCYGVNEKTSIIHSLNSTCLPESAWDSMKREYSSNMLVDSQLLEKLKEFRKMPFSTEVLYFPDSPEELIGISHEHYSIRYVYNPDISDDVLSGLSPELSAAEKKRIGKRILTMLMKHQCEKGRKASLRMIEEE